VSAAQEERVNINGWLVLVSGLALVGCGQDTTFNQVEKKMEVTPDLTDLGDVIVGDTAPFTVELVSTQGDDITVSAITVQNVDGTFFSYVGDLPLTVPAEGTVEAEFEYSPMLEGYHRAQMSFVSDAHDSEIVVEARGRGVNGAASVRPLVLDFGAVGSGETNTLNLIVANEGNVPLEVIGGDFSDDRFDFADLPPLQLAVGDEIQVPIRFSGTDDNIVSGTVDLDLGGFVTVSQVQLRVNDCEHGTPTAYDRDSDGYTSCAGDCDDDDSTVHPGGVEVADGADQDCDGTIDEGTSAYDDDGDGLSEDGGDCNDGDDAVNPNETEDLTNGIDDDCDGTVDYGTTDADGDGYSEVGGDCDDVDPATYPGAPELADNVDNDCDATIDEGTTAFDDDGDGVTEAGGDCDDTDSNINPAHAELPDWTDNDCDGTVDEGTVNYDDDSDGFTEVGGDCDDNDSARNPGEPEINGNSIDDDCNGVAS
jgi:hypothetical protein